MCSLSRSRRISSDRSTTSAATSSLASKSRSTWRSRRARTRSMLVKRQPTARRTYGLKRTSILASLANAVLLLLAVGMILWEAVQRLARPESVAETTVIWVAAIGIAINTATALMFRSGAKGDINVRGVVPPPA